MVAGLLIRWWSAVRASLAMVVDLLLMHRLSVSSSFLPLVCLLLCHWSAVALSAGPSARASLVYLLLCRWSVCSLVTRPSVRVMSLVRLLESWSLVRLFGSWSLACSSVAGLLFVRHWPWSSICHSYIARASARLVVGVSLVCRWCVTDLSLTCLFVCLWPVAVLYLFTVTGPSLIRLVVRLFVHYWCVCSLFVCGWSVADLSTQVVAVLSLDSTRYCFASVRLFGSTLREARLFGSTLGCSTAPLDSPCIPISICWLCLAVRVITHSVPRVVSRHFVITHLLFHGCSHRRCLVWSSA